MGIEERLFLSENYEEEMNNYQEIVSGKKQIGWDWIIITASNEEQKKSYLEQIEYRKKINFFPRDLKIDVIADPNGERVGSGGATINVLKTLSEMDPDFLNKKIMLIHSGGDSKRYQHVLYVENCFQTYQGNYLIIGVLHFLMNL